MNEKRTPSRRSRAAGFTLLEVLIVTVIMGVITGIAVPSFVETIRQSHVRAAADGMRAFLQATSIEAKRIRRNQSVLFTRTGATRYVSENCTGVTNGTFSFDDETIVIGGTPVGGGAAAYGVVGLPPLPDSIFAKAYTTGTASVGDGWGVGGRQCLLFRADSGAFGISAKQGGVLIRFRDNPDYGAWIIRDTTDNRFQAYTKEHGIWVKR